MINLNLKEQTDQVLKTLTPREEKVIKMRFGVGDAASTRSRKSARTSPSRASASGRSKQRRCASCVTVAVAEAEGVLEGRT